MRKYFVLLIALLVALTACTAENNTELTDMTVSEANQNTTSENVENKATFPNLNGTFKPLKEAVLPYSFYVDIDGEKGVLAFWLGD